jgi:hypothetical protein
MMPGRIAYHPAFTSRTMAIISADDTESMR